MININKSIELFAKAQKVIPGGVNSPVRAFKSVGGNPLFIKNAKGAYLYDEDGNKYIDYISSWGPLILGHAYEPIVKAIQQKVLDSTSFGAPTALEIEMAELIHSLVPSVEMVRMVNSGTEACMSALRLARGYTGKNKFIKFDGCYHGHADAFLVNAGSGVATLSIKQIPGITSGVAQDTLVAPYNNVEAVRKLVAQYKGEIAAIIIEPVAGNMGCVLPKKGFLEDLRKICTQENIVLIFDEVMTGFRLSLGGAQAFFNVEADLVTYGKVIGAGLPVGAFGGKKEIMKHIAPLGDVYQAGTLSGNPLAMIAGYTLLKILKDNPSFIEELNKKTELLSNELKEVFKTQNIPCQITQIGSMMSIFFTEEAITDFDSVKTSNIKLFNNFFHNMLEQGVYLPPSGFESWFLNNALSEKDIDYTIKSAKISLNKL